LDEEAVLGEVQAEARLSPSGCSAIERDFLQQRVNLGMPFHGVDASRKLCIVNSMDLSAREQIVFDMLRQASRVSADDIIRTLRTRRIKLAPKRDSHTVVIMMRALTAKACQEGWIISMVEGGRGAGRKAVYSMKRRFKP